MKKKFFGISMRPVNATNSISEASMVDHHSVLYTYLTRQLIEEFLLVNAEIITPSENVISQSAESGYRFVFTFEKEEYFSDIVKTTDLVIDDMARVLIDQVAEASEALDTEMIRMVFNRYFKAYCVEQFVDETMPDEEIIDHLFLALDTREEEGRNINAGDASEVIGFLRHEAVRHVVDALAVS